MSLCLSVCLLDSHLDFFSCHKVILFYLCSFAPWGGWLAVGGWWWVVGDVGCWVDGGGLWVVGDVGWSVVGGGCCVHRW